MAALAHAAGPVAALGLAGLVVSPARWARLAALVAWGAGSLVLAAYLAPAGHTRALVAAGVVGVVLAGALAGVLLRWPWLLAVATLALAPARIPVSVGSTDANLLVPLYGVAAAAALALAWRLVRGDERSRELGALSWPLAALVGWTGLSLAWTQDLHQGSISLLFFWLPFGLLAVALARLPWSRRWLTVLYVELAGMAVVFGIVGVYQWATRDVFWNPKVIVGNAYAPFYRVNSVFWDPSIYGRFLVVAILASLALVLHGGRVRLVWAGAAAIAVTWVGLLFSFSQSSFVALLAGVFLAAAVAWRWRAAAALGLVAAVLLAAGFSAPRIRHTLLSHSATGLNHASSGRFRLVTEGARIAIHHPVGGVGIGAFRHAYAARLGLRAKEPKRAASHDTPVTVAAETGFPGLLLLGWLLVVALAVAFGRLPRSFAGRTALVTGLGLAAIAVHSLFYNAFFEDPMAWGFLALVALSARALDQEEASA